jgi:hypothetical protein
VAFGGIGGGGANAGMKREWQIQLFVRGRQIAEDDVPSLAKGY